MVHDPTYKLALVTGATSGIGEAFARLLASKNVPLIISGRNQKKLDELAKELNAHTIQADLLTKEGREKIVKMIREKRPDLLVNNAGFSFYGEVADQPLQDSLNILKVNAEVLLEFSAEAVKVLKQNNEKGTILNVASAAAWPPFPLSAVYGASKSFVYQLSRSMDYETKPYGIRVFAACPGVVSTHFSARALHKPEAGRMRKNKGQLQLMSPEYAANQMWIQLQKQQQTRIFNWVYRLATFLGNHVVPEWILAKITQQELAKLLHKKEI